MDGWLILSLVVLAWLLFPKRVQAEPSQETIQDPGDTGLSYTQPFDATADATGGNDALDNIMQGIFQFEGRDPSNINWRNNNPGNLRAGPGMTGTAGGFATFADLGDGWDALQAWVQKHVSQNPDWDFYDLFNYFLRGKTDGPTNDAQGNSDAYAEYVAGYAGFDPSQTVSSVLNGGN